MKKALCSVACLSLIVLLSGCCGCGICKKKAKKPKKAKMMKAAPAPMMYEDQIVEAKY